MISINGMLGQKRLRGLVALALILLLAAGLRLWRLDQNGYGNLYCAATVRSMLVSWRNFFFGAFDPGGFLSVDKPPVSFWIQAASAKLLGFNGFSLILTQALEGVAAVALIYHLVQRRFGVPAALLASLVLAITPVSVAIDRSNHPDSSLVLVLLTAGWALSLAAERGRLGPLLLSAALVGVGFNIKMLVAFGVLPTFIVVSLLGSALAPRKRLLHLIAAFAVLTVVSASWGLAVDLTPAESRPYVGSSSDNSVFGLIFGYNGLERVLGLSSESSAYPTAMFIPGGGRQGMPGFGGPPGILRLAGPELAGQVTWLVPLAVVGSLVAVFGARLRRPLDPNHLALLLWGGWLGTYAVVFSLSRGIIHPYYLVLLAPPLAALVGIGVTALWGAARRGWGTAALAGALVLTALWEARILADHPVWQARLLPIILFGVTAAVIGLIVGFLLHARWLGALSLARASLALGLLAVLVAPMAWSLMPVLAQGNPMIPAADPALLTGVGGLAPPYIDPAEVRPLVSYLQAHRTGESYLLATSQLMVAALIIIETGDPVIAIGGFMGNDPALTPSKFAQMVSNRRLRFVLLTRSPSAGVLAQKGSGLAEQGPAGCRVVSPTLWRAEIDTMETGLTADGRRRDAVAARLTTKSREGRLSAVGLFLRVMELYDCGPRTERSASDRQFGR
jgi:4-amino-4-deoxy-L-arabinose transferase-like glycosyltransferase